MSDPLDSLQLFTGAQEGQSQAAQQLFDRYVERLLALARSRMSPQLRAREDEEDVVQSVCRSFFARAREGQFVLERSGDLWRLLAAITINKVRSKAEFHGAAKRKLGREVATGGAEDDSAGSTPPTVGREPAPDDLAAVQEELRHVMAPLAPHHRQMLEMRLQGESVEDIAAATQRTEHQVRRVLGKVRDELERRLSDSCAGSV